MSCPLHFSWLNYGFAIFCKSICRKRGVSIFFKSIWHQSSPQFSTNNRAYVSATGLKQTVMKGERCLIFTESSKRTSQFEAYILLLSAFWKRKQNFWVDNEKNLSEAATDRLLEQFVTGEVDMDMGTGCSSKSKVHFLHPKMAIFSDLGCKKMGPNEKTDTTFCRQLYPKTLDETLVSYEYHYRVSFGQILKISYFRLIFGRFPIMISQNQNPMLHSVNFWDKNLILVFGFLTYRDS